MVFHVLSIDFFREKFFLYFSYTPLIIAIQQMLEYDNVNRLSDGKVCFEFLFEKKIFFFINLVT